jgi:broad specificity phosphatase PhoE
MNRRTQPGQLIVCCAAIAMAMVIIGSNFAFNTETGFATRQDQPKVLFLVRHAEKAGDGSNDPKLTETGLARAEALARLLRDAGINRVHSTDYQRTRATAAPTAELLNLKVELYDAADLASMARQLRAPTRDPQPESDAGDHEDRDRAVAPRPSRHLIVGHSNTTTALVELLGGEPGPPIDEASEHDRLYIVTLAPDGTASTIVLRYGE